MAQYTLGKQCMSGRGIPQDIPKAIELYAKAAGQGYKRAQFRLGRVYESGVTSANIPKDPTKAARMYQMVSTSTCTFFISTKCRSWSSVQAYMHKHGEAWKALRRILRKEFVEERIEILVPTLYDLCCLFLVERESVFLKRNNQLRDEEEGIGKKESDEIKKQFIERQRSKTHCSTLRRTRDREYRRASDDDDTDFDYERTSLVNDPNGADDDEQYEKDDHGDHNDELEDEEREMRKWERILPLDVKDKLQFDYKRCGNPVCRNMGFFFGEGRVKRRFVEKRRLIEEERERTKSQHGESDESDNAEIDLSELTKPFGEGKWICWQCRFENSGLLNSCALCRENRESRLLAPSSPPMPRGNPQAEKEREREMKKRDRALRRSSQRNGNMTAVDEMEEEDNDEDEGESRPLDRELDISNLRSEYVAVRKPSEGEEEEEERYRHRRADYEITLSFCSPTCASVLGRFLRKHDKRNTKRARFSPQMATIRPIGRTSQRSSHGI